MKKGSSKPDPTDSNPLAITLPKRYSVVKHLTDRVREKILSGEMPPGCRLPSTAELAKQWGTYVPAVQAALSVLTREGLLDRRPCRGTYVKEPDFALTRVGILASTQLWTDTSDLLFTRQVFLILEDFLLQRHIHTSVWFENRRGEKSQTPLTPLVKAVDKREVQAIIALNAGQYNAAWLNALPVPVTGFSEVLNNHVAFDYESYFDLSLKSLAEKGCRSVALISAISTTGYEEFGAAFFKAAERYKIKTRKGWVRDTWQYPTAMEQYGYNQFQQIWAGDEHPEGLIAYPDVVAHGVLLAISTLGIRAGRDIHAVFHRNAEVPFLCPFKATFVESRARDCVEIFHDQLSQIHRNEPCPLRKLPFYIAPQTPNDL